MAILGPLTRGPDAYAPRTGWPPWAALPAGVGVLVVAFALGAVGYAVVAGMTMGGNALSEPAPAAVAVGVLAFQVSLILLTWLIAGLFSSDRKLALALVPPAQGWSVVGWSLIPLFAFTLLWTGAVLLWDPSVVVKDLRPFEQMLRGDSVWLVLLVMAVGAPISEELMFRGFLFSALAKSRLRFVGTAIITAALWSIIHYGYSLYGLVEIFGIGLYFAWLLVRTGSVWVTIICHGIYNAVVAIALILVPLPAPEPAPVPPPLSAVLR
jgi:membrane protease YdiL (CAAX protease family)